MELSVAILAVATLNSIESLAPKNGARQRVLFALSAPLPFVAADVIRPLYPRQK
jgi:hypothetical protein